jgi:hypothetical protein
LGTEFQEGFGDVLSVITGVNTDGSNFQGRALFGNPIIQSYSAARAAVKVAPPPVAPTSSGLPVGTLPTNAAGTTPGQVNNPQVMAGSDDSGVNAP